MIALNSEQLAAVNHGEGPLLIFAGAGSGKTRVLTHRVARLIEDGIDPYNILAITFTNKAAREMRERISDSSQFGQYVWVSTFHSACVRLMRRENVLGTRDFSIYDAADSLKLVRECVRQLNLSEATYAPRRLGYIISAQKNALRTPEDFRQSSDMFFDENVAKVYELYQAQLAEFLAVDFDDIIFKMVLALRDDETLRHKIQRRFVYVLVDEYQDTNHAQYQLVKLLGAPQNNICVVGDDDQSIYSWRGADISNILNFNKDYPGAKVVRLEENYRSTKAILNVANEVISNNRIRAEKALWTANEEGQPVCVHTAADERAEADFVVETISAQVEAGARAGSFAVLYRSHAQSRLIEDMLVAKSIPYRMLSGVRFYEHMEVKDVLAYLFAICNPLDELAHLRIINVPRRGIGTTTIGRVVQHARAHGIPFSHALAQADKITTLGKKAKDVAAFSEMLGDFRHLAQDVGVASLINEILTRTKYVEQLQDGTPEAAERVHNILELLAGARDYDESEAEHGLQGFLEQVQLMSQVDNYAEGTDAVALMTLHSAKGLEFERVFVVGIEEGIFPSAHALESGLQSEIEEERRLMYVGITRARKVLWLTHATRRRRFEHTLRNKPGRFLDEIPQRMITRSTRGYDPARAASLGTPPRKISRRAAQLSERPPAPERPTPKVDHGFEIGDMVVVQKFGTGQVVSLAPAGADTEVSVFFEKYGTKKVFPRLTRIVKVE